MLPNPYGPEPHDMKHVHDYMTCELTSWFRDKIEPEIAQGIEASGGDGTAPSRSDESPVAESDAP